MIEVYVAKIINDTMTRKKKKVIHKTHASICQRIKATSVIIGLSSAWLKDGVNQTGTVVKLIPEKDDAEFDDLSIEYLKKEIIKKYALEFSLFDIIPEISISKIVNKKEVKKVSIIKGVDIPTDNQKRDFKVNYKHSDDEGNIVDS